MTGTRSSSTSALDYRSPLDRCTDISTTDIHPARTRQPSSSAGDRTRRWLQSRGDGIDQPLGSRRARARPGRRAPRRDRRPARRASRRSRSCSRSPATPSGGSRRSGCGSRSGRSGRGASSVVTMDVAIRHPGHARVVTTEPGQRAAGHHELWISDGEIIRTYLRGPQPRDEPAGPQPRPRASIPGSTRAARRSTSPSRRCRWRRSPSCSSIPPATARTCWRRAIAGSRARSGSPAANRSSSSASTRARSSARSTGRTTASRSRSTASTGSSRASSSPSAAR